MTVEDECSGRDVDEQRADPNDPCALDGDDPYLFSPLGLYAVYNCLDTDGNPYLKYVPVITMGS